MTSLPERLRSQAKSALGYRQLDILIEAADELDRQAGEILMLRNQIREARLKLVERVREGDPLPGPPPWQAPLNEMASQADQHLSPPDQADVPIEKLRAYVEDEVIVSPEVDAARWYAAPDPPEPPADVGEQAKAYEVGPAPAGYLGPHPRRDPLDAPVTRREVGDLLLRVSAVLADQIGRWE